MIDRNHAFRSHARPNWSGSAAAACTTCHAGHGADLVLMRRIDELHLGVPVCGARMLRDLLYARRLSGRSQARRNADAAHGH